jgi:hypothetical protein
VGGGILMIYELYIPQRINYPIHDVSFTICKHCCRFFRGFETSTARLIDRHEGGSDLPFFVHNVRTILGNQDLKVHRQAQFIF